MTDSPKEGTLKIHDLLPDPRNPRSIKPESLGGLQASLRAFGDVSGVTWNKRTGELVAGHQRMSALKAEADRRGVALRIDGKEGSEVIVLPAGDGMDERRYRLTVVDMDRREQTAANIAANNPHIGGDFTDGLAALLVEVETDYPDLFDEAGFSALTAMAAELGAGVDDEEKPDAPDAKTDRAAELAEEWGTALGQVWEVPSLTVPGRCHRVMCGDCRNPDDVARLLGGARVNVAFTSPPYASQRKYDEESGFKPIPVDDYVDWFEPVQSIVKQHLAEDGSWFVNIKEHCEDGQRHLYVKDLTIAHVRRWGRRFVDELCWKRKSPPGSWPNRLRNDWEPIFHFAAGNPLVRSESLREKTDSAPVSGGGRNDHLGDHWHLSSEVGEGWKLPGNVVECSGVTPGQGHQAAFPVALPAFFIKAYSDPGDVIFDPFFGSGTTVVAAEREGRLGYGTELSPKYLAVILQRLKDMGLEPRRVT